jgi:hypothetical protein
LWYLLVSPASLLAFPILVLLPGRRRWLALTVFVALPLLLLTARGMRDLFDPSFAVIGPDGGPVVSCTVMRGGVDLRISGTVTTAVTQTCTPNPCHVDREHGIVSASYVFIRSHEEFAVDIAASTPATSPEGGPPLSLPATFQPNLHNRLATLAYVNFGGGQVEHYRLSDESGSFTLQPDGSGSMSMTLDYSDPNQAVTIAGRWTCPS